MVHNMSHNRYNYYYLNYNIYILHDNYNAACMQLIFLQILTNWDLLKAIDGAENEEGFSGAPQEAQQMLHHLNGQESQ